ncbi:hypothetical protein WICMUC_000925 [Wickerhamomyces mucosus]|uniref:non-specific serine/threonine protein kinase n=1 Tax=Wickerhamomyces mucosus TaxID=1378264 RepID=A0A9P8THZ3_9ASCO|nr:hypothetical protein WICMUC_000925 [Wickerhamomyces mucosus]
MPYSAPDGSSSSSSSKSQLNISIPSRSNTPQPQPQVLNKQINVKKNRNRNFYLFQDDDDDFNNISNEVSIPNSIKKLTLNKDTVQLLKSSSNNNHDVRSINYNNNNNNNKNNSHNLAEISLNDKEILKFPKESIQSYSYAHLSPNSLALRLSILKRSLEILIDRPELIDDNTNINNNNESNLKDFINQISKIKQSDKINNEISSIGISNNASSAALSAFFNDHNLNESNRDRDGKNTLKLNSLINLLNDLNRDDENNNNNNDKIELATNLLELSLAPAYNKDSQIEISNENLKIKLLYALATPFYEPLNSSTSTTNNLTFPMGSNNNSSSSSLDLSLLTQQSNQLLDYESNNNNNNNNNNNYSDRIFHTISQKNSSPQAIFTCDYIDPWNIKAANDLACLIFGVSRNSLKRLTLLDLVSPDSRDFVLNKLISNSMSTKKKQSQNSRVNNMIFAGEIIAIAKPGNKLTWASLWAKKRGEMIICMFDQVPCDSIDLIVNSQSFNDKSNSDDDDEPIFNIQSFKKISNSSKLFNGISNVRSIDQLVEKFDQFISKGRLTNNSNIPLNIWDSQLINEQRYFTIKKNSFNIPCAITSKIIDETNIKLKIHSLPYIAGVFIISFKTFKLLSFNESISKNLFGFNEQSLINQSIEKIIPNFIKMFEVIIPEKFPNLKISPGLVLPEHFFRQINSILQFDNDESKFLNSIGLNGLHSDGSTIKIDVQLRVSNNNDTLILWITHSRSVYGHALENNSVRFDLDNDEEDTDQRSNEQEIEKTDKSNESKRKLSINEYGDDIPSQLSMLKEDEIQSISRSSSIRKSSSSSGISTGSSSSTLSLTTSTTAATTASTASTRKTTTTTAVADVKIDSSTGKIPIVSNNYSQSEATTDQEYSFEKNKEQALKEEDQEDESALISPSSDVNLSLYKVLDQSVDEDQLLKLENETIERTKSFSKLYPRKIGLKRREKSIKEFKIIKKMGQGAYGKVVLAENIQDSNYKVVIKLIIKERILVDTWVRDRKLGTIPSEIQIMSTLNKNPHPNIMRLIDFFEDDEYYYIETPPHDSAIDLFDYIELKKTMNEYECKSIIKQCVSALNHLHNNGVVHRDIKDENLIIDKNGVIKLIDFGSAAYIKQGPFDVFVGTLDYAAPEVLNGQPYEGKPQDVWSLGILIYTLIYKENPFYNVDEIMDGELRLPFIISEGCVNLIKRILQRDIKKRPNMEEILQDPWLN